MTNTTPTIQGTGIICKGNVKERFEIMPMELLDYVQLNLISHTDLVVYMKLLQLYNGDFGYAFPTVSQLMMYTHIGGKATIHSSLNTLENIGLIQKSKTNRGNNIYVVYKPLSKEELYSLFPERVKQLRQFEAKIMNTAEQDKKRYQHHQQREQQLQATKVVPNKVQDQGQEQYHLPEKIENEMRRKLELLKGVQ